MPYWIVFKPMLIVTDRHGLILFMAVQSCLYLLFYYQHRTRRMGQNPQADAA